MRLEVRDSPPPGKRLGIALLHEGPDPSMGAPESVRGAVRKACRAASFGGREKERAGGLAAEGGWLLVGLGSESAPFGKVRRALRRALREASRQSRRGFLVALPGGMGKARAHSILRELAQADYRFDRYKSQDRPGREASPSKIVVLSPRGFPAGSLTAAAREAEVLADASAWARDLGNTPANDLGPAEFAREARKMARREGLRVSALGRREIEREKMGGLLAVNSGSARPPVFLIGEYRPARARATVVLVGKGITFDSGGISIKPAQSMGEMKYDMMGAATVFACLAAAKRLALPVRLVALAPLTENLPSGTACRPGDILRMRNGKTVEVENTDAEGRLVLADALSYAAKFRPDLLMDFATLTGAALVALGHDCAALMTPDDELARELLVAGQETGERVWRLPLWEDYRDNLKSDWADMKNSAGRIAGTINAGIFLKEFVPEGVAWAHLDIAGVAHFEKEYAGYDAGATGFGVALTIEFLKRRYGA